MKHAGFWQVWSSTHKCITPIFPFSCHPICLWFVFYVSFVDIFKLGWPFLSSCSIREIFLWHWMAMFVSLFSGIVCMEPCRLMWIVISALKSCTREIMQQSDQHFGGWWCILAFESLAFNSYNRLMATNL